MVLLNYKIEEKNSNKINIIRVLIFNMMKIPKKKKLCQS